MNIKDKLRDVIYLIHSEDNKINDSNKKWDINYQYRLISTNGKITELNPLKTFVELGVKNNETIILLFPEKISFSDVCKSTYVFVSSLNFYTFIPLYKLRFINN